VAEDSKKLDCIREGVLKQIHGSKLVCGDLIKVSEGMNIPCDGYVISSQRIETDESAMTGETDYIKKGNMA